MNKVLSTVNWRVADVHNALAERLGRDPSDTEIEDAIQAIDWETMQDRMIETGWDFIYAGVDAVVN